MIADLTDALAKPAHRRGTLQAAGAVLFPHIGAFEVVVRGDTTVETWIVSGSDTSRVSGDHGRGQTSHPLAGDGLLGRLCHDADADLAAVSLVVGLALRKADQIDRVARVSRAAYLSNRELRAHVEPRDLIFRSPAMREVVQQIDLVAPHPTSVLLLGETGTGKERLARRLHARSGRSGPFLPINCGALPEQLVESALFGHEKGAFTGATQRQSGYFERAHGGTLFLDEVGELPAAAQAKLLRVLQDGVVERVGGHKPVRVDVRIVAATHRDLSEGFRTDLWHRIGAFPVRIPPLRERPEDLAALSRMILARLARRMACPTPALSPAAAQWLAQAPWPGNVRELENVLERAMILSAGDPARLSEHLCQPTPAAPETSAPLDRVIRDAIHAALATCNGQIYGESGAAHALGIPPSTLQAKIRKLGIDHRRFRGST